MPVAISDTVLVNQEHSFYVKYDAGSGKSDNPIYF